MSEALARSGAALIGGTLAEVRPLHGGSLSQIVRIALTDGREAVVKTGPNPRIEAAMLTAIAGAGAAAPAVLAADDAVLVMERLEAGDALSGAWPSLGAVVAKLHAASGERYGWDEDYAFGAVAIVNRWSDDWPAFWAENRLRNNLPHLPLDIARRIEALADDLANRLPSRPRPALLHGDLWGGNVLVSGNRVVGLVDPACYYGDAEVDLAMLTLFDAPDAAFRDAYGLAEPGFRERTPIYRLWPALVHLRLFGAGYRAMVEGLLSEAEA